MTSLTDTQVVTASGGLVELGFYKLTDSLTISASSWSTPDTIIPNTTVVCDGSPVVIDFSLPSVEVSGYGNIRMSLYRDNTLIAYNVCYISNTDMYSGERSSASFQYRDTPTAGSHTYSVRALAGGYGAYIYTSSGTSEYADGPGWMRVSKVVQATQWPAVTTGTIICTSSTRPSAPFEGQTIYETDTKKTLTYNGSGWYAFNQLLGLANQTSIQSTTSTSLVDITASSITAAVAANRRIRMTARLIPYYSSAGWMGIAAMQDATQLVYLNHVRTDSHVSGVGQAVMLSHVFTTSAAATSTFKWRFSSPLGNTVNVYGSSGEFGQFTVEDIGPA